MQSLTTSAEYSKGGWNLFHTWWHAANVVNPVVHFGIMGGGQRAWYGWPDVPLLDKLFTDWVRATDQTGRKLLAAEIQKVAFGEVACVPWGEWFQPTAFRITSVTFSSLTGRFSGT
jgi:peptide/nickel transport system substrate-binding protein